MKYIIRNYKNEKVAIATNKQKAKKLSRLYALEKKQSMYLYSEKGYVGTAEFPYYLRNHKIDISDIHFYEDILPF